MPPILFMITKEIKYNTAEYTESLRLRSDVLRVPLGKELSDSDTFGEERQLHFGCFKENQLKGCIVAKPTEIEEEVKLRQMAVTTSFQGKGAATENLLASAPKFPQSTALNAERRICENLRRYSVRELLQN